jgi:hypothetical protein
MTQEEYERQHGLKTFPSDAELDALDAELEAEGFWEEVG